MLYLGGSHNLVMHTQWCVAHLTPNINASASFDQKADDL
jgi:hypothetical protein